MGMSMPQNWVAWLQALGACAFGFVAGCITYGLTTQQWNSNTLWAGLAAIAPTLLALLKSNPWASQLAEITTLTIASTSQGATASVQTTKTPSEVPVPTPAVPASTSTKPASW